VLAEDRFECAGARRGAGRQLDSVTLCHDEHYVGELRHIAPSSGLIYIDGDTSMSPGTWEAVMRGVGGAVPRSTP
jgi:acetoin utilization deacetylase AcuC-like enzyme